MTSTPDGLLNDYHRFLLAHSQESDADELLGPSAAATDEQVGAAENALGVLFDDEYRAMLLSSDGWPSMEGMYVLYGTADFLQRPALPDGRVDNMIPDATEYFASQEFDDPSQSVVFDPEGYRSVVVGRSTVSSQFFVMRFATTTGQPQATFWDCMSSDDDRFDGIGSWLEQRKTYKEQS